MAFTLLGVALSFAVYLCLYLKRHRFKITEMNINLGNVGCITLTPNQQDLKIAHQIWTELVTRKATIPIDPEHDVIHEIFDSWYQLFGRVRLLIADIPAEKVHDHESTRKLVDVAVKTLNDGLRPPLTKWQARYRHWHALEKEKNPKISPQELQKRYPQYDELMKDMKAVNGSLIEYAGQLKKLLC